jgi:hypothetical protein
MSLINLVKTNQLEPHPFDAAECGKLLAGARRALKDAQVAALSDTSRMSLAYDAIQQLCTLALRLHGYRPATRTPGHHALVIQLLEITLGLPPARWRELDLYRRKRNLADYSGDFIDDATAYACVAAAARLLADVEVRLATLG